MRDDCGNIEPPTLILKKKSGGVIGTLGDYIGLKAELKFNQKSTFSFEYPSHIDQIKTPFYEDLICDRLVRIDPYGVFLIGGIESVGTGISEKKLCTCYSLEYELDDKALILEAGTYRLYDVVNPSNPSTVLGRILEKARNWKIGSVSESLRSIYRTFDDTEVKVYGWMIDTLQVSFGCVFSFNTYTRTIDVFDADADVEMAPIYLSYDNMIKDGTLNEVRDQMYTKLSVQGAEPLTIHDVNPIGSGYIYNIDYFLELEDISPPLASKWSGWQSLIAVRQQYYTSLVGLRNAAFSRYQAANTTLTDLRGELSSLDNLRSSNTQGLASSTTTTAAEYYAERLTEIAGQYSAKQVEIRAQETVVELRHAEYQAINEDIAAVVAELAIENYFSSEELSELDHYFKEDTFVDPTFAVYDVDVSGEKDSFNNMVSASVNLSDSSIEFVEMVDIWGCETCHRHFSYVGTPDTCPYCDSALVYSVQASGRKLYNVSGGAISITGMYQKLSDDGSTISGLYALEADIIKGTVDRKSDGEVVCSFYIGYGAANGSVFPSGNLTIATTASFESLSGNSSFEITGGAIFFTRNVTDSQRYYVAKELYDYAVTQLADISLPTYSFELSTVNPIFAQEFEPFKDALKFGFGCYLSLNDTVFTKQMLLEIHLDFDDPTQFSMIFSNEFKRPSHTNKMKAQFDKNNSASATLSLKRFNYGDMGGAQNAVYDFLQEGLIASSTQVFAGKDQDVLIGRQGIKIGTVGGSEYILMSDGMIAIVDENGNSKMAMGHFYNTSSGQNYYGVLADVIGGNLLVGLELNITCPDANGGVAQFKVDSTGAFLNNGRFYLQSDSGGRIGMDGNYGIFAGNSDLFTTTNTGHVSPSFVNESGNIELDDDGMPLNTNFMVDIKTGNVYMRGKIVADSGFFRGVVQASSFLDHTGTNMMTSAGKFKSNFLDLGNIQLDGVSGDITLTGNINITGNINWGSNNSPVLVEYSTNGSTGWHSTYSSSDYFARYSYDGGVTWTSAIRIQGQNGSNGSDANVPSYIKSTYIDNTEIRSPKITGTNISVVGGAFALKEAYNENRYVGIFGYGTGVIPGEGGSYPSDGVVIEKTNSSGYSQGIYLIVTDYGVRMTAGINSVYVTESDVFFNVQGNTYRMSTLISDIYS